MNGGITFREGRGGDLRPAFGLYERTIDRAEAEIGWCERIAKKVEAGEPYLPDGSPGDRAGWPNDWDPR